MQIYKFFIKEKCLNANLDRSVYIYYNSYYFIKLKVFRLYILQSFYNEV